MNNLLITKIHRAKWSLYLLIVSITVLQSISSYSQTELITNINIPSSFGQNFGGNMAWDILSVDNRLFVYTSTEIQVFTNGNDESFIWVASISFGEYGISGKFNPPVVEDRIGPRDSKIMAVNKNGSIDILYVLTPDLHIIAIDIDELSPTQYSIIQELSFLPEVDTAEKTPGHTQDIHTLSNLFNSLNGGVIVKFDDIHDRLYVVVSGREPIRNTGIGSFHYFGQAVLCYIINSDSWVDHFDLFYEEYWKTDDHYKLHITDIEFNHSTSTPHSKYFYVARAGRIDCLDADVLDQNQYADPVFSLFTNITTSGLNTGRHGRLKYINTGSKEFLVSIPYLHPTGTQEPDFELDRQLFVISMDHSSPLDTDEYQVLVAPHKRCADVEYFQPSNELIVCFAPGKESLPSEEDYTQLPIGKKENDIARYLYENPTSNGQWFAEFDQADGLLDTDNQESYEPYDSNQPIEFLVINDRLYILKKDGVKYFEYQNNSFDGPFEFIEAESNFFTEAQSGSSFSYILNLLNSKIFRIKNVDFSAKSIKTGHIVHHIAANTDGSKKYYFNKLNTYNTGLYIHSLNGSGSTMFNTNEDDETDNDINSAIGDVVFNPFKNHFIVSKNESFAESGGTLRLMVFDGISNEKIEEITYTSSIYDAEHPTKMMISEEGELYVGINMRISEDPDQKPHILSFNANYDGTTDAYPFLTDYEIDNSFINNAPDDAKMDYYSLDFCYNKVNGKMYATIGISEFFLDPYQTANNRMHNYQTDITYNPEVTGSFLRLEANANVAAVDMFFPGKLLCPENHTNGGTTQFAGMIFIIGEYIAVHEVFNQALSIDYINTDHSFNDFCYSADGDKLIGIKDVTDENENDRKCAVYNIEIENEKIICTNLSESPGQESKYINGQVSFIINNPINNRVHIYNKIDDRMFGEQSVLLYTFDPKDYYGTLVFEELGFNSFYQDICYNADNHYYLYNITTPYISFYEDAIYLPNGGHSSVTRFTFEDGQETLTLNNSLSGNSGNYDNWSWFSIPRMLENGQFNQTDNILLNYITPQSYNDNSNIKYELQSELSTAEYTIAQGWNTEDLSNLYREFGYKLNLKFSTLQEEINLSMEGPHLSSQHDVTVIEDKNTWVGYWIDVKQSPFDAIPESALNDLIRIKTQYWDCYKDGQPSPDGSTNYFWQCGVHQGRVELKYGDLVILCKSGSGDLDFKWQFYGPPPTQNDVPPPDYFTFDEQSDYTSFYIELDSTENPQEVGAFVDNTCVGATTVLPEDSIVMVPGYMEGMIGDVTFQEYYSTKSTLVFLKEYFVRDSETGAWTKQRINTAQDNDRFNISFRRNKITEDETDLIQSFKTFPNPTAQFCNFAYFLQKESDVEIKLFDSFGKLVAIIKKGKRMKGYHLENWNLIGLSGRRLQAGIYFVELVAGGQRNNTKLMVY